MEEKKSKGNGLLVAILIIIMLALAAGMVYLFLENQKLYSKFNETIVALNKNVPEKTEAKTSTNVVNTDNTETTVKTNTEDVEETESLYALVEKLAAEKAIENHPIYLSGNMNKSYKAKSVMINDIEICTKEYVDIMVDSNITGQYPFQQQDLKTGNYEILGTVTFTLEFEEDITNGTIIPFGDLLKDNHHAIVTRGYRVSKENGEYKIEFGEG